MLYLPAGKTFTQLGKELGLTNAYTAQLFYNQVSSHSLHAGSCWGHSLHKSEPTCPLAC